MIEIDQSVIAKCQKGDIGALSQIIDTYKGPIINFIGRHIRDWDTAEDIAQEVFLKMFDNVKKFRFDGRAKFSTWLFTIARNTCIDAMRTAGPQHIPIEDTPANVTSSDTHHAPAAINEEQIGQLIAEAVGALPAAQQRTFILKEYQGLSCSEIAEICGCPVDTVKTRLFRAKQALRKRLEKTLGPELNLTTSV